MQDVDPGMLLCAFRYALGRRTYVVEECCDWLVKYWDCLPVQWQKQIHEDIKHAIRYDMAGAEMDVDSWSKILELPVDNI